ncbi:hypothetical protein NMY22_g6286 [Coprinellus aureogranulatus]|nr:hypothetical protein NMY22_g6286 [Coprinellus aureogranulatus]
MVVDDDPVAHKVAVHSSIQRCDTNIKNISLREPEVIIRSLQILCGTGLETACLRFPSISSLPIAALLPQLLNLEIACPDTYDSPPLETIPAPSSVVPNPFPSLRSLNILARTTSDVYYILAHLPRNQGLQTLVWTADQLRRPRQEYQSFFETLKSHSDLFTLRHLEICEGHPFSRQEPVEADPRQIDLTPLFTFNALQSLDINIAHSILITPSVVSQIPVLWPHLCRLILEPSRLSSHPPAIDHTHIFELVQGLPNLTDLGVRFDASRITGKERIAGHGHRLRTLKVGKSPISSPLGVIAFLRYNFPNLETLHTDWEYAGHSEGSVLRKRWNAVLKGWKLARA